MSKARKLARAEREAADAARAQALRAERHATRRVRARLERRVVAVAAECGSGRTGQRSAAHREAHGVLAALVLLALLVVYLLTGSWSAVIGAALFAVIATPVLAKLVLDRSHS